jgi:hypothetical protein
MCDYGGVFQDQSDDRRVLVTKYLSDMRVYTDKCAAARARRRTSNYYLRSCAGARSSYTFSKLSKLNHSIDLSCEQDAASLAINELKSCAGYHRTYSYAL